MLRSEKHEFVADFEDVYRRSTSLIVTHYHGLTVVQLTKLRRALKEKGAGFKIVKNTLSKIAARNAGIEDLGQLFFGPTAIAYSEDPVEVAKVVVEFVKANEKLIIVGGMLDKKLLDVNSVQDLAKLPSMNELRGKIACLIQAPAAKIASVLQAPGAGIARLLQAHSAKS